VEIEKEFLNRKHSRGRERHGRRGGRCGRRGRCGRQGKVVGSISRRLIDVELVMEVVEELVGRTREATGGGEREVCSHEKVGQILG
jgi:hypothetical protein